jgi:hypothetical protein
MKKKQKKWHPATKPLTTGSLKRRVRAAKNASYQYLAVC